MSNSKITTIFHPILSCTPMMTKGKITPKVMQEFKSHCAHYFINTKDRVTNKAKVTKILGCFEESMVDDWTSTNQEQLMKMTFPDFMKEFQQ